MGLGGLLTNDVTGERRPQGANAFGSSGGLRFVDWPGLERMAAGLPVVTREQALGLPGIGRGVEIMAAVIASLNIDVVRGQFLTDRVNEVLDVPTLLRDPDPFGLGRGKWHTDAVGDLMLAGNALGDKRVRNTENVPVAVPLWEPERVSWERSPTSGRYQYVVSTDTDGRIDIDPGDMWHAAVGGRSGKRFGVGILGQYAAQLKIMLAVESAQHVIMQAGKPVGVLSIDADMLDDELKDAKRAFINGVAEDGIAALVKAKFESVSWSAQDLALVPAREYNLRAAALITGIPGYMLGVPNQSRIYSNAEMEWRAFVTISLAKLITPLQDAWSKCFPRHTNVRYATEALFRAEAKTRWETYALQAQLGATSVEEIRQEERMGVMLGEPYPIGAIKAAAAAPNEEADQ